MSTDASSTIFYGFLIVEDFDAVHPSTPEADNWLDFISTLELPPGDQIKEVYCGNAHDYVPTPAYAVAVKRTCILTWDCNGFVPFSLATIEPEDHAILEEAVKALGLDRSKITFGWYHSVYMG